MFKSFGLRSGYSFFELVSCPLVLFLLKFEKLTFYWNFVEKATLIKFRLFLKRPELLNTFKLQVKILENCNSKSSIRIHQTSSIQKHFSDNFRTFPTASVHSIPNQRFYLFDSIHWHSSLLYLLCTHSFFSHRFLFSFHFLHKIVLCSMHRDREKEWIILNT